MAGTILYTPSREELEQLAKENPEIHLELKEKLLQETKNQAIKYVQGRVQGQANKIYEKLFEKVKTSLFKSSFSNSNGFSDENEKQIIQQIESLFAQGVQDELNKILNSEEFKKELRVEFKRRMSVAIMKSLENEINEEAKKFVLS